MAEIVIGDGEVLCAVLNGQLEPEPLAAPGKVLLLELDVSSRKMAAVDMGS